MLLGLVLLGPGLPGRPRWRPAPHPATCHAQEAPLELSSLEEAGANTTTTRSSSSSAILSAPSPHVVEELWSEFIESSEDAATGGPAAAAGEPASEWPDNGAGANATAAQDGHAAMAEHVAAEAAGAAAEEAAAAAAASAAAAAAAEEAAAAAAEEAAAAEAAVAAADAAAAAEDEILPLEQWKEQAHAILQAHAIQFEAPSVLMPTAALDGSAEGGAGAPGPAPTPGQPLPFVRPSTPLKDRFNYLTSGAGAKVLAKSGGMENAGHILDNDRDRYMMAERDVKKKSVTLALIEDILLDTVVIGNFEVRTPTSPDSSNPRDRPLACHPFALSAGLSIPRDRDPWPVASSPCLLLASFCAHRCHC